MPITHITKRNGEHVPFQPEKITRAILGAFKANGYEGEKYDAYAGELTEKVVQKLCDGNIDTVEGIQDTVEDVLMQAGECPKPFYPPNY